MTNDSNTPDTAPELNPGDVEGHAASTRHIADDGKDVEGHAASTRHIADDEDDVEGHAASTRH